MYEGKTTAAVCLLTKSVGSGCAGALAAMMCAEAEFGIGAALANGQHLESGWLR